MVLGIKGVPKIFICPLLSQAWEACKWLIMGAIGISMTAHQFDQCLQAAKPIDHTSVTLKLLQVNH